MAELRKRARSGGSAESADELDELARALQRLQRLRASKQVFAALARTAQTDLPRQAIEALAALGDETLSVAEIARRARMDLGATSRQLRALERSGHVTKSPSADNRSIVLVAATRSGREASRRVKQIRNRQLGRAIAGWSPADRHRLASLLDRLVTDLQATPYERD